MTTLSAQSAPTLSPDLLKPYSQPRQSLLTHLRLTHLLHHRNKNQHRRNQWFRHFSTFRREVGRLCGELGIEASRGLCEDGGVKGGGAGGGGKGGGVKIGKKAGDKGASVGKAKATGKGIRAGKGQEKRREGRIGSVLNLDKQADRAAARRKAVARLAFWMESGLPGKWYIAFTTLTSTPSFAPLSLTLLALLARVLSLTGVTTYITSRADQEDREEADVEDREMQAVLARFADEDVGELLGRGAVGGEQGGAEVIGGDVDDEGVVVEREDGVSAAIARTTDTTSALTSHPGGPLRPTVNRDKSSTSSPAPITGPTSISISTATSLPISKSASTPSRYTSKIRSSPLTLTHSDLDANPEAGTAARPKKRKQAGGRDPSADTSAAVLATKKKRIRTTSTAIEEKEAKEEKRKGKGKGKNAIDDLFAGLT